MKIKLTITKVFDDEATGDIWGLRDLMAAYGTDEEGFDACATLLQEDVAEALDGAIWALEDIDGGDDGASS